MSEAEEELTRYEQLVREGAWYVHDGLYPIDELEVPQRIHEADDQPDVTDEEFRDDIREYMEKVEVADPKTKNNERDAQQSISELDWAALWDEFGFGEPDAVGFRGASLTQLRLAIDATDQGVNVAPEVAINDAVDRGEIVPVKTPADEGTVATRGYCRPGGGA